MIRSYQPEDKENQWSNLLPLSDNERQKLQQKIQQELEAEHQVREERAQRKVDNLEEKEQEAAPVPQTGEIKALRSHLRRQFYEEHGYKLRKDPTGRDMWLSPTEQEFRSKRNKRKRSSKKNKSFVKAQKNNLALYAGVVLMAVVLGLLIVKRMS